MSQYLCPQCGSDSKVIDTRPSYKVLRRRRHCIINGHKFSTHEVSADSPERLDAMIEFIVSHANGQESDMIDYGKSQLREVLFGLNEEDP
jgi:transcriptional regulator NrdR family protein